MTQIGGTRSPGGTVVSDEIARIAEANGGRLAPTDAEAREILAARGMKAPANPRDRPTYAPPERTPADYASVSLYGVPLPEGVDQAALTDGAKALGYALQLDPVLAGGIARDMAHAGEVDPAAVRELIAKTPHSYDQLITLVDAALARAAGRLGKPVGIAAKELPAHSLVQLGVLEQLKAKRSAKP